MSVRNNLKSHRHKHEMNSKEFACFINVSPGQYSRYENNRAQPSLEIALKISDCLDVSVNDIFYIKIAA